MASGGPANDINAVLSEVQRLQSAGYKLKPGETWFSVAGENLSHGSVLGRIGQLASKLGNLPPDLVRQIKFDALIALLGIEGQNLIQRFVTEGRVDLNPIPQWAEPTLRAAVEHGSEAIGAPLFDLFIRTPLGIELSDKPGAEGSQAIRALERLFGFGMALELGTSEAADLLKGAMGENAPTAVLDALRNLPMTVGVNWAVGFILSQFVWSAYMPPLVEQANRQVRPTRLNEANLLALFKRNEITADEFLSAAQGLGWRDEDIGRLVSLDRTLMSLADLQAAWLQGLVSEDYVRLTLQAQGINEEDTDTLVRLYLTKSETAGGQQLRAVAQTGFLQSHIDETQYREFLKTANVPELSIDLEIEAAKLVKLWGRVQFSTAEIKKLRQDGLIDDHQAVARLMGDGWSEENANLQVAEWNKEADAGHPGLTESRILSYLKSGVIEPPAAYDLLIGKGMRATDARFLVEHPDASPSSQKHAKDTGTIVAAYKDGVLDLPAARVALISQGMSEAEADLRLQVANVSVNRGKRPRQPAKLLDATDILEAFKLGLAVDTWAIRELVTAGYSPADAELKVAIEKARTSKAVPDGWTVLE